MNTGDDSGRIILRCASPRTGTSAVPLQKPRLYLTAWCMKGSSSWKKSDVLPAVTLSVAIGSDVAAIPCQAEPLGLRTPVSDLEEKGNALRTFQQEATLATLATFAPRASQA